MKKSMIRKVIKTTSDDKSTLTEIYLFGVLVYIIQDFRVGTTKFKCCYNPKANAEFMYEELKKGLDKLQFDTF